jgi:hypothetical protein
MKKALALRNSELADITATMKDTAPIMEILDR